MNVTETGGESLSGVSMNGGGGPGLNGNDRGGNGAAGGPHFMHAPSLLHHQLPQHHSQHHSQQQPRYK